MHRGQLEHLIRAACMIIDETEVVVDGSQAILVGVVPDSRILRQSMEADMLSLKDPTHAELIDGAIGELSMFHETFGYYAHGIGLEALTLAEDGQDRLVVFDSGGTRGNRGLCLSVTDVMFSKLVAGRDKDRLYVREALRLKLVDRESVGELIGLTGETAFRETLCQRMERWCTAD
ncbi:MAG: hypothetical protein ACI8T1_000616 [Verrucomicrobiales bacterium]|jgi:hypothetical protein